METFLIFLLIIAAEWGVTQFKKRRLRGEREVLEEKEDAYEEDADLDEDFDEDFDGELEEEEDWDKTWEDVPEDINGAPVSETQTLSPQERLRELVRKYSEDFPEENAESSSREIVEEDFSENPRGAGDSWKKGNKEAPRKFNREELSRPSLERVKGNRPQLESDWEGENFHEESAESEFGGDFERDFWEDSLESSHTKKLSARSSSKGTFEEKFSEKISAGKISAERAPREESRALFEENGQMNRARLLKARPAELRGEARRGFIWAKIIDEPRFKKRYNPHWR